MIPVLIKGGIRGKIPVIIQHSIIDMASTLSVQLLLGLAIISIVSAVGLYEQCAGEGYGTYPCNPGLTCFRRNKWFSSCQTSCPLNLGWECELYVVRPPVSTVVANWDQCGGDGWVGPRACGAGYACYARSVYYSQVGRLALLYRSDEPILLL